ncbi:MAG: pseudouridine synthase [Polyangiaceae bacterium]
MSRPQKTWVVEASETLGALLGRSGALTALAAGRVFVDGRRCQSALEALAVGARVELYEGRDTPAPIRILARERGLVFAEKPVGIATEPDRRGSEHALVSHVAKELGAPLASVSALSRLDVGVSGVVVLGLDAEARQRVVAARERGALSRRYVALAVGVPAAPSGVWNEAIAREGSGSRRRVGPGGEPAETHYAVTGVCAGHATLALAPRTGRTHQLRVHASFHGAALLGDATYGARKTLVLANGEVLALERIFLHAAWVAVGDAEPVRSALPAEFESIWDRLGGEPSAWQRALEQPVGD